MKKIKFIVFFAVIFLFFSVNPIFSQSFTQIEKQAKNQTVYFNAWGGFTPINDYIAWTIKETKKRFGIKVVHTKINDTAIAVNRILAEKNAGKNEKGSVDLIWINGENFKTMKDNNLLFGPFTDKIPNMKLIDFINKEFLLVDFSVPTDGFEAPWGTAKFVFFHDMKKSPTASKNIDELLILAKKYRGRMTYPKPPDFHGTTFLKQVLLEKVDNQNIFQKPVSDDNSFQKTTQPLWEFLDEFHPYTWRKGKSFPKSLSVMNQMLNDGELFFNFSFNPNQVLNLIERGELPSSIKTYVHEKGTIANGHFLAIPFNSSSKEAAMVYINFLLSPEAQARKENYQVWGDPTVLSLTKLNNREKQFFKNINNSPNILSEEELGKNFLEPHYSWVEKLEKEWIKRYGS